MQATYYLVVLLSGSPRYHVYFSRHRHSCGDVSGVGSLTKRSAGFGTTWAHFVFPRSPGSTSTELSKRDQGCLLWVDILPTHWLLDEERGGTNGIVDLTPTSLASACHRLVCMLDGMGLYTGFGDADTSYSELRYNGSTLLQG